MLSASRSFLLASEIFLNLWVAYPGIYAHTRNLIETFAFTAKLKGNLDSDLGVPLYCYFPFYPDGSIILPAVDEKLRRVPSGTHNFRCFRYIQFYRVT